MGGLCRGALPAAEERRGHRQFPPSHPQQPPPPLSPPPPHAAPTTPRAAAPAGAAACCAPAPSMWPPPRRRTTRRAAFWTDSSAPPKSSRLLCAEGKAHTRQRPLTRGSCAWKKGCPGPVLHARPPAPLVGGAHPLGAPTSARRASCGRRPVGRGGGRRCENTKRAPNDESPVGVLIPPSVYTCIYWDTSQHATRAG